MLRFIFILLIMYGCETVQLNSGDDNLFPDDTPVIFGLLESSNDFEHAMPAEVVVGLGQHIDRLNQLIPTMSRPIFDHVQSPILFSQLISFLGSQNIGYKPNEQALVLLFEKESGLVQDTLRHQSFGVYHDHDRSFQPKPNTEYELQVTLQDGSTYLAQTKVPVLPQPTNFPDVVETELELSPRRGSEGSKEFFKLFFQTPPQDIRLVEMQRTRDADTNLVGGPIGTGDLDFEDFADHQFGDFWRLSGGYIINEFHTDDCEEENFIGVRWRGDARFAPQESDELYLSIRFLNQDMSIRWPYRNRIIDFGGCWSQEFSRMSDLLTQEGPPGKLFERSNIRSVGDTKPAIGFFGAYSSLYRKVTLIPIRSWDPDTLEGWPIVRNE